MYNNFIKILIASIPLIIIALIITFYSAYTSTNEDLILSERDNSKLQYQTTELKKLIQNEKHEVAKLLDELSRIKITLTERENRLKEVESNVYRHYKTLEELGKSHPDINNLLKQSVPNELWNEMYGTGIDANKNCQSNSARVSAQAVPSTQTQKSDSTGVDRASDCPPCD